MSASVCKFVLLLIALLLHFAQFFLLKIIRKGHLLKKTETMQFFFQISFCVDFYLINLLFLSCYHYKIVVLYEMQTTTTTKAILPIYIGH